jgi:hypothetical protein
MTTVQWDIYNSPQIGVVYETLNLAHLPPEPVLPHILANRNHVSDNTYLKCPAFIDYYKNVYVIKSPFSMKINFNSEAKYLSVQPQCQEFYDTFLRNRADVISKDDPFLFSILIKYLFTADADCILEELPVMFHDSPLNSKLKLIPGTYNIGKWFRPIEVAYEVMDKADSVTIKRGDPLFYVRFVSKDNKKINLKHAKFSPEQLKAVQHCTMLKKSFPNHAIDSAYKFVEKLVPLFRRKKCPFNWSKK